MVFCSLSRAYHSGNEIKTINMIHFSPKNQADSMYIKHETVFGRGKNGISAEGRKKIGILGILRFGPSPGDGGWGVGQDKNGNSSDW